MITNITKHRDEQIRISSTMKLLFFSYSSALWRKKNRIAWGALICCCEIHERRSFPFWDVSVQGMQAFTQRHILETAVPPFTFMVLQNQIFSIFLLSPPLVSRSPSCNFNWSCSAVKISLYLEKFLHRNIWKILVVQG